MKREHEYSVTDVTERIMEHMLEVARILGSPYLASLGFGFSSLAASFLFYFI